VGMSSTPMMDSTCDTVLTSSFCGHGIAGHSRSDGTEKGEERGDGEGSCVARRCKSKGGRDQRSRCEAGARTVPIEWHPVHSSGRSHPICNGEDEEACQRQTKPDHMTRGHTTRMH
jgi:hypothetical protein